MSDISFDTLTNLLPSVLQPATVYDRNCELRRLAAQNIHKYGILGLAADLGSQDYIDEERFRTVYPYSSVWVDMAHGTK